MAAAGGRGEGGGGHVLVRTKFSLWRSIAYQKATCTAVHAVRSWTALSSDCIFVHMVQDTGFSG